MKITNGDAVAKEPEDLAKALASEFPELAKWAARPFVNRRGPKTAVAEIDQRQTELPVEPAL